MFDGLLAVPLFRALLADAMQAFACEYEKREKQRDEAYAIPQNLYAAGYEVVCDFGMPPKHLDPILLLHYLTCANHLTCASLLDAPLNKRIYLAQHPATQGAQ